MSRVSKSVNACCAAASFMMFVAMVLERDVALALLNLFSVAINLGCVLFTEYSE